MATDTRSVWVEVEYRRPFSGVPSVTTLSFRRPPSATTFNFFRTTLSCDPLRSYAYFCSRTIQLSWKAKADKIYRGVFQREWIESTCTAETKFLVDVLLQSGICGGCQGMSLMRLCSCSGSDRNGKPLEW